MIYSKEVLKHFKKPKNQGTIKDADAIGQVGNVGCGDVMKIYLKIEDVKVQDDSVIKNIKFETLGCAAAIAVSSAYTERIKGKTIKEALGITKDDIVQDLGGLPAPKIHCSMLAIDALKKALKDYKPN
ncbi:MAG: iron-sulfur cluster assembly scaffold protein [bacterium]